MVAQRFVRSTPDKSTWAAACSCETQSEITASISPTMLATVSASGLPLLQEAREASERRQNTAVMNALSWSLRGWICVVALAIMEMMGWREASLPPLPPEHVVGTTSLVPATGAAATKLVAARRKAGIKERTRIVSEG